MIRKIDLKENEVLNYNNCIYSDYKCNCTKDWKEHNKVIVYYLDKENCIKLLDEPTENIFDYSKTIYTFLNEKLKGSQKLLVAGGHTVINLKDRNYVSNEVITSVKFGMQLLKLLSNNFSKIDFIIPLNDFFMEKDAGTNENMENSYRKEALEPYILPKKLKEIFNTYLKNVDFELFFCSEKNMADKFKRHIKNTKKNRPELFKNYGDNLENWAYILNNTRIEVITNNKPNCVAGNAATFRDINFIVNNSKIKDNYDSHIGIYPLCSLDNVINGYLVGNDFYKLNLPTILIFYDKKCY